MKSSRLKFGQLGGSVNIPPGMGYEAHRIGLSNVEGGYPNTCKKVKAEISLTFIHTGQTFKVNGMFSSTDGQQVTSEPAHSISLQMLQSTELLLLNRDSISRAFRTISHWPFLPESESRLEFGDWRLEVSASCDSEQDVAFVAYDLRLKPDLSSAWSPVRDLGKYVTSRTIASPPKAFVSHSSHDHEFVEKFAADLRTLGVDAWYSGWEIKPGDSIRQKIDAGLRGCEFFIIVLSKTSISRPWVHTELDAATVGKLKGEVQKIIPIKIEDCGDLPPTLGSLCWEDFSTRSYESALKRVHDSIFEVDVRPPLGPLQSLSPEVKRPMQGFPEILSAKWGIGDANYRDKKELLEGYLEAQTPELRASNMYFHDDYPGEDKHFIVRYRWPGTSEVKTRTFAQNDRITF